MIRWKEDGSEIDRELRDALRAISRPRESDAAMLRRIGAALPLVVAAPAVASASASAFGGGVAAKALLVAALAGGIAAAAALRSQAPVQSVLAPAPVRVHVKRTAMVRYAEPPKVAVAVAPTSRTLAEEARLLLAARKSIASDPEQARALLELYQRRYPQGSLQEERAVLEIEIARAKGEETEALTKAFMKRFPRSAHGERIRAPAI